MDRRHTQRQSFDGFDRKRLRGTLQAKLGVVSNADVFASRGDTWETTEGEAKRALVERQLLEAQLRDAGKKDKTPYKPSETRNLNAPQHKVFKPLDGPPTRKQRREIERFILGKLADAGPLEPVKVNKQTLAAEKKHGRPARRPAQGAYAAVALKVNRLAKLHKERLANEKTGAVTSDKRKEYGHFVMEKD